MTAPAASSLRVTSASSLGIRSSYTLLAAVVLMPAVSMLSLSAMGIPCSGGAAELSRLRFGVHLGSSRQRNLCQHGNVREDLRIVYLDPFQARHG